MSVHQFFRRYAELALGPSPEALAPLYAPTFIIGGPEGSRALPNDRAFLSWLGQVGAFNREHRMRALTPLSVRESPLNATHTVATVTWDARFDKTGDRPLTFDITYLLERGRDEHGEPWRILAYISQSDQQAEMAKAGLL